MKEVFFTDDYYFPEAVKVRLPQGKPSRVFVTLPYLCSDLYNPDSRSGEAEFEIVLLDDDGYMTADQMRFTGKTTSPYSREVPGLSVNTRAVYVIPKHCTTAYQPYRVQAGY